MNKKLLTAVAATVFLTTTAFADGGSNGHGNGHGNRHGNHHGNRYGKNNEFGMRGGFQKMYRQLDLNDAQKAEINAIFSSFREKNKEARTQVDAPAVRKAFMDKRQELIHAQKFDKTAFAALLDEQYGARKAQALLRAQTENKAWNVLTPEQKEKALEKMRKRAERAEKRQAKKAEKMKKRQERRAKKKDDQ